MKRVKNLIKKIKFSLFGTKFTFRVEKDNEFGKGSNRRVFLQVIYTAACNKTGESLEWKGRKYYLSKHMLDDEIVKTAWVAIEAAVKHEVMENFKVNGKILFNPHTPYTELLALSDVEVARKKPKKK